jgi:hypothetical protein
MRAALVALACVAAALAATAASSSTRAGTGSPFEAQPPAGPPRELVLFGYVRSLVRRGARFELRFDPADYLSGETGNRAAIEDGVIPPGDVVPNDHYIRDEGHRLVTYLVPPRAHVTVVTNRSGTGLRATAISVAELAAIVKGRNPRHRALFEPKNGFWLRVASDTVRSLDQQYSP